MSHTLLPAVRLLFVCSGLCIKIAYHDQKRKFLKTVNPCSYIKGIKMPLHYFIHWVFYSLISREMYSILACRFHLKDIFRYGLIYFLSYSAVSSILNGIFLMSLVCCHEVTMSCYILFTIV